MRLCLKNVDTRLILFRNLLNYDYKIGYGKLINNKIDNKIDNNIIVAYNCFDDNIVGAIILSKDSNKVENIYLDNRYSKLFCNLRNELINISKLWYN